MDRKKTKGEDELALMLSVKVGGRNGALDKTGANDVSTIEFISSVKVRASMDVLIRFV